MLDINKPPRKQPKVRSAPKIRQMYWCDFPADAILPEMWKERPVIVVSKSSNLYGCVTVVPCSSKDQWNDKWCVALSQSIDGGQSYAICNQITSVSVARLRVHKTPIALVPQSDFDLIVEKILKCLPTV